MIEIPMQRLKSFIFENETTFQSETFDISVSTLATEIQIRYIVDSFKQKHSIYMPLEWKVYDPNILTFKVIDVEKPLSEIYLLSPVIMLKYKELGFPDSDCDSLNNSKTDSEGKKERNKERSIKEVIQCVKKWREIHNTLDKYKNKVNLYDAAKAVGIAKKSLDDYFCQLRLAEEYGFDFERNFNQKIGLLRSFVRKNRPKGQQSHKHERLPKRLRIIEDYHFGNGVIFSKQEPEEKVQKMQEQEGAQTIIEVQYEPPMPTIVEDEMENRFLSSFNFMVDDPTDPFINYGYFRTNSNKLGEVQSSDYLFF